VNFKPPQKLTSNAIWTEFKRNSVAIISAFIERCDWSVQVEFGNTRCGTSVGGSTNLHRRVGSWGGIRGIREVSSQRELLSGAAAGDFARLHASAAKCFHAPLL